ncbi:MAG: hypothetical protein R3264_03560, partial [Anaerolineae bacterium]|nr:hypothetical protein [Anaerolineae bacterium]
GDEIEFPAVPNRWLISRSTTDQNEPQHWIVESDYLFPPGESDNVWAVCFPFEHQTNGPGQFEPPFRYMGRALSLDRWLREQNGQAHTYLPKLTAVGYGEPTFAAFYPNCFSVFGFADQTLPASTDATYTLFGWYTAPNDDFCQSEPFQALIKSIQASKSPEAYSEEIEAFEDAYHWTISRDNWQRPERLLCYAQVQYRSPDTQDVRADRLAVKVALGNTGTEALSAFLAHQEANSDQARAKLEDRLEAINLMGQMEQHSIDIGPKFLEARHSTGFRPVNGGTIWTIQGATDQAGKANVSTAQPHISLDAGLAHLLNQLNLLQQQYDSLQFEIESRRTRIFSDWYKYMLAAYPAEEETFAHFDIDEIRLMIEAEITDLEAAQQQRGGLIVANDNGLITGTPKGSIADRIAKQILQINRELPKAQLIQPDDIIDWTALIQEIAQKKETIWQPLQKYGADKAYGLLSDEERQEIIKLLQELGAAANLNETLSFPDGVPQEATTLLAKNGLADAERYRLNRLILQAQLGSIARQSKYELGQIPGPRYWAPNEPVVLIKGEGVRPTGRYDPTKTTACTVFVMPKGAIETYGPGDSLIDDLNEALTKAFQANAPKQRVQDGRPWHPFLLEWEAELYPTGGTRSNIDPAKRAYQPDFIQHNYELAENTIDLGFKPGRGTPVRGFSSYSGRSILTPGAKISLDKSISQYLEKRLLGDYFEAHKIENEKRTRTYFQDHQAYIIGWYEGLTAYAGEGSNTDNLMLRDQFTDQVLNIRTILSDEFHILAQSLGGFNDALLGHKLTMQLPVADPLGFEDYQPFAARVREAVQNFNRVAPQPTNDFNPIRTGHLQLTQLRLIDTFGQARNLNFSGLAATDQMFLPNTTGHAVQLPARLVQPARLNFRWLANGHGPGHEADESRDDAEMNSHPTMTPICGWLVANNLNSTILIYSTDGQALGYLDKIGVWREEPGGRSQVTATGQIQNPHLRRVAQWIENKGETFVDDFITMLDSAQENINPANFAQHLDLALLMSRPVAVVRTTLKLQGKGLPAINQDGVVFSQDLKSGQRETDAVEQVRFPIRLGEHRQLNDGLIGYWKEQPDAPSGASTTLSERF